MALACSVVIPTYNAAETLGEQLEALARQDGGISFEVIVADNGSTDDLARTVGRWSHALDVRLVDASARRRPSAATSALKPPGRRCFVLRCGRVASASGARLWWTRFASQFVGGRFSFSTGSGIWLPSYATHGLPVAWDSWSYAFGGNFGVSGMTWTRLGGFDETLTGAEEIEFAWRARQLHVEPLFVAEAHVAYRVRNSLRGRLWHEYNSGRGTAMLAARVMPDRVPRRSWKSQLRHYLMLSSRFPLSLEGPRWTALLATLAFEAGGHSARRVSESTS